MKAIKTAIMVVGVVAAVVGTAGLLAPVAVGAALGSIGLTLATVSAIGMAAGVIGGILNMVAPSKPKQLVQGSATRWQADTQAGIPIMLGRTFNAGNITKRETFGTDRIWQGFQTVYSLGPIAGIDQFYADRTPINFAGDGNAIGGMSTWMYFRSQLGLTPTPAAMNGTVGGFTFPGWTADRKGSGLAASLWFLKFDKNGKKYQAGVPNPGVLGRGILCYDPRKDSTYPGGSGAHRWNNPATHEYSNRPALIALKWAIGFWQNGLRRAGIGFDIANIDMGELVAWANVCDANNWTTSGVVNTQDDKWNVLKAICQSGGCEPTQLGGKLSFNYFAPRVSVATITSDDVIGRVGVVGTKSMRERVNTIVPRVKQESHGWEVVPLNPVSVPAYIAADGETRTREMDLQLVDQIKQAAELATYEIVNARELAPIDLALKLKWIGLKPGLCVTLNIPEANLNNLKALCRSRTFDPENAGVQLQMSSETDEKHAFALGKTTTAPPIPNLTSDALDFSEPAPGAWAAVALSLTVPNAGATPAIRITGAVERDGMDQVVFEYKRSVDADWQPVPAPRDVTTKDITGLYPDTNYDVAVRYVVRGILTDRRVIGTVHTTNLMTNGRTWIQNTPPTAEESAADDLWMDSNGKYWRRLTELELKANGQVLEANGQTLTMWWTPNAVQPVSDAVTGAINSMQTAINAVKIIADDALATADGKIRSFYQPTAPVAEGYGDIWYDTDDGKKPYLWNGSMWVAAQDESIADALDAAIAADAKADGKATTYISETNPGPADEGDMWFKKSTGELRTYSVSPPGWGDAVVDLTANSQITVLVPQTLIINRNSDLTVKGGQLPVTGSVVVKKGEIVITKDNSVQYVIEGLGALAGKVSIDTTNGSSTKGDITYANTIVTGGTIRLNVHVGGNTFGPFLLSVETKDDAPPVNNGTAGGSDTTFPMLTSSTYVVMTNTDAGDALLDVTLTAGQVLKVTANIEYNMSGNGTASMYCYAEYSANGGTTWLDFTTPEVVGAEAGRYQYFEAGELYREVYAGYMLNTWSKTGLAAGTYKVRIRGKKVGGGAGIVSSGSITSSRA